MIVITIEIDVPFEKDKEFIQSLLVILERIRMKSTCLSCDFLKDLVIENRYRLIGKWEKETDLKNHLESEEFSVLRGAMSIIKKKPEISLHRVAYTKGLDSLHIEGTHHQKTNNLRI